MKKTILIKPLITEKSEMMSENENKACFVVHRRANKIEIKNAIEKTYNVSVVSVNTAVMPGKAKSRNTKSGVVKGSTSSFKKAIVKLAEGETLDLYGEM
jgi:large subunit ribosomal protein L23